jgi:hypothetical protein
MTEGLQERALEKFINKALPHNIQILKTADGHSFSSAKPAVLLFTPKSTISLSYRILSFYYRESLSFFHIKISDDDEDEAVDLTPYGVTSLPALGVRLADGKFVPFPGDIKNNVEILDFLSGYGARVGAKSDSKAPPSSEEVPVVQALTAAEFNALFTSTEEAAYLIAVTKEEAQVPSWWTELSAKSVGAVRSAFFKCGVADLTEGTEPAQLFCSSLRDSDSLVAILPFSLPSKKKVC